MKKRKQQLFFVLFFFVIVVITFLIGVMVVPKADKIKLNDSTTSSEQKKMEILRICAIGDSLTEGIGDKTKTGGYVPLLQTDLTEQFPIDVVQAENFGKSGDRSDQILKRLKKNDEMQESVKKANVILLTVGGNDLLKIIHSKIFSNLTLQTIEKPRVKYENELEKLYEEIRSLNQNAPIYQLGIYNPYSKSFPEITEIQDIIDYWNEGSKEFVDKQENAYFVPINDEIVNGTTDSADMSSESSTTLSSRDINKNQLNDLISEDDSFHPNNLGYQIIANAFEAKMESTKDKWLK